MKQGNANTVKTLKELAEGVSTLANRGADTIDNLYTKAVNRGAVDRLAQGIEQGADGNIKFARVSKDILEDINSIRSARGLEPLSKQ